MGKQRKREKELVRELGQEIFIQLRQFKNIIFDFEITIII